MAAPGRSQEGARLGGGLGIAGHDDRGRQACAGERGGVVEEHGGVAAVGATDEQDEVSGDLAQGAHVGRRELADGDVHDAPARREGHPAAGLRRHLTLLADDRDPQATAGGTADERVGTRSEGGERAAYGLETVHDIGGDGGRVGGDPDHDAVGVGGGSVDEHSLGERRPHVDARHQGHVASMPADTDSVLTHGYAGRMKRNIFDEDHESFRKTIRAFIEAEVVPHYEEWYEAGLVPREFYHKLAELGIFGIEVPEEYGGAGLETFKYEAVMTEEVARAGVTFGGSGVHVLLCLPYIKMLATEEQKQRWLPKFVAGEEMWAIAMTEPGTGSDLAGMKTTAKLSEDGTHYVLNGAKTFITGGVHADKVIVCARTAPADAENRRKGISLLVVDTKSDGYAVGRKLDKLGLKTSDTAELSFTDVRVPAEDLLGEEGEGFSYLGRNLPQERLGIALGAYAQAAAAIRFTQDYVTQRVVFGQPVAAFQNTKFELAACKAKVDAAQAVVDRGIEALDAGELTPAEAASAKLFCTEVAADVIDRCLQLHGGYGFMNEYPIARLYADNRVNRIYGGTSEVMKSIISKDMGL